MAAENGFLESAVAYTMTPSLLPPERVRLLHYHPVRLLSLLDRVYYQGAKKHAVDRQTARMLETGRFDFFHSWSGDCLRSLRVAKSRGIPSMIEIPTWHRNKGRIKKSITWSEVQRDEAPFPQSVLNRLLVTRQQVMEEYALADLILVLSEKARETFQVAGVPDEKLFLLGRGADPEEFYPADSPPKTFRVIFVGSLIRRKGVHLILDAWKSLQLPNAELFLCGGIGKDIEPLLRDAPPNVRAAGHVDHVASELRKSSIHIFPSECEGAAKATYEAAASGLPQITTRESGDMVKDGENGILVPPNDVNALTKALTTLHANPELVRQMGTAARKRFLEGFTWDHFRQRLLKAYSKAMELRQNPQQ
jgi:glycosyltransferase involved in cell wall biosynthesis